MIAALVAYVVGLLLAFRVARDARTDIRYAHALADSLDALITTGRCVWVAGPPKPRRPPADTVGRR